MGMVFLFEFMVFLFLFVILLEEMSVWFENEVVLHNFKEVTLLFSTYCLRDRSLVVKTTSLQMLGLSSVSMRAESRIFFYFLFGVPKYVWEGYFVITSVTLKLHLSVPGIIQRYDDVARLQEWIFLLLMLVKEMRGQREFKIFLCDSKCEMVVLRSLQTVKNYLG